MAQLTQLESKLAEVIGLAQAAQDATRKVARLVDDQEVTQTLQRMGQEAKETEARGVRLADGLDGKKTALLGKARETKSEATEMMKTYLGNHADALDGLEFLIMAEAGELGHVEIVKKMNEQAGDQRIGELAQWAVQVQRRHFDETRGAALKLASQEDPNEPEG
jgi:hypothetical protein